MDGQVGDLWFTGDEMERAARALDETKAACGAFTTHEGQPVVEAFGLPAAKTYGFANSVSRDTWAIVREHGGSMEDMAVTMFIDGILLGLMLALTMEAARDEKPSGI